MTDINMDAQANTRRLAKTSSFSVEDTYWGYVVKSGRAPSIGMMLAQGVCFFLGACFLTAAAGILILPTLFFDGGFGVFRIGTATLLGSVAIYLLWYASRGTQPELHVDTSVGEIREVISNRAGRPTTVGCYGFDTIGGVYLEQSANSNSSSLVLQYRSTEQTVHVADGIEATLVGLRDRLAQDLMVDAA